ncbi:LacI family DNA-binding transcriptional regulator [Emticicia sp. BO119]|uniref:LacI family DNA-binding transcriptional regulator n=1 Tax=Emticicia sp. BO119 TaxID=2757768 RepID=UPI0015F09A6E|nr:LacI family DNA-binding transcriptional regulator [Emticicia sp. BO119]MBA4851266.1 LacI family DNA-binding transcriptional regulator [Emticicia sp. BO119]
MKKKRSIYDVANELQVSVTTLSFVLNGKGQEKRISKEVIHKIETYIKEIGYQPNHLGRSLSTGKSKTIGMIVGDINNPFFSEVASGIEKIALQAGYTLIVASSNNELNQMKSVIKLLNDRNVDGFIISPITGIEDTIADLRSDNRPMVIFNCHFPELDTFNVVVDNKQGAFEATRHLYENGFRNIGFITLDLYSQNERIEGYSSFIESRHLNKHILKLPYKLDYEQITHEITQFLTTNQELDSVFFSTNFLTLSGLKALSHLDGKYAKMGIVSFDDHLLYDVLNPGITAIKQPVKQISSTIIHHLLNMMDTSDDKRTEPQTIVFPVDLIVRTSSFRR